LQPRPPAGWRRRWRRAAGNVNLWRVVDRICRAGSTALRAARPAPQEAAPSRASRRFAGMQSAQGVQLLLQLGVFVLRQ
jgi:hypothetical protein